MAELGTQEEEGHRKVGCRAATIVDLLITIGPESRLTATEAIACGLNKKNVKSVDEAILMVDYLKEIHLIPNVQTRLRKESMDSFLSFFPRNTKIWIKDHSLTLDIIEKYYDKASSLFDSVIDQSGKTTVVLPPKDLFESARSFSDKIREFSIIEFGNRFTF